MISYLLVIAFHPRILLFFAFLSIRQCLIWGKVVRLSFLLFSFSFLSPLDCIWRFMAVIGGRKRKRSWSPIVLCSVHQRQQPTAVGIAAAARVGCLFNVYCSAALSLSAIEITWRLGYPRSHTHTNSGRLYWHWEQVEIPHKWWSWELNVCCIGRQGKARQQLTSVSTWGITLPDLILWHGLLFLCPHFSLGKSGGGGFFSLRFTSSHLTGGSLRSIN